MKNKLLLISGMDFAGKSTVVKDIANLHSKEMIVREKLISPPENNKKWQMIIRIRKSAVWTMEWNVEQREKYEDLMYEALRYDLEQFCPLELQLIQDTLFLIKRYARLIKDNNIKLLEKNKILNSLLPKMDSIYLTASPKERLRRFNVRMNSGSKITKGDQLLHDDPKKFFELDDIYKEQIFRLFPNTLLIDTTNTTSSEAAFEIIKSMKKIYE